MIDLVTITGLAAGCCTTAAFIPQVLHSLKTKKTTDLSIAMLAIIVLGDMLWLIHGIWVNSIPIIAANAASLLLVFALVSLKLRYG
ncbi:PQ loop repeat protein [Candidatus Gugararchaeum adminiculabundum]|nr:PQ loop repeat protein [Candidatus Gugararchaeum adminiculabundum]